LTKTYYLKLLNNALKTLFNQTTPYKTTNNTTLHSNGETRRKKI